MKHGKRHRIREELEGEAPKRISLEQQSAISQQIRNFALRYEEGFPQLPASLDQKKDFINQIKSYVEAKSLTSENLPLLYLYLTIKGKDDLLENLMESSIFDQEEMKNKLKQMCLTDRCLLLPAALMRADKKMINYLINKNI